MPVDQTPTELRHFWGELKHQCEQEKPSEVCDEEIEALRLFHSDFWKGRDDQPDVSAQINLTYMFWKWFVAQVLGKDPTPACKSANGSMEFADLHNRLKTHTDREARSRQEHIRVLFDAFTRGTGFASTYRDRKKGLARTKYINVRDVFIDPDADRLENASFIIERHQEPRYKLAKKFGAEIANALPPLKADSFSTEAGNSKFAEIIEYHLAYSRYDDERRVYAFHENWSEEYLNVDAEGKPGEPWNFDFGEEEWHLTPLILTPVNDEPWGVSYYTACKGPIQYVNFLASYILQASQKSAKQIVLYPTDMGQVNEKIANSKEHLACIGYEYNQLRGRTPKDIFHVAEYPPLPASLFQGFQTGKDMHDLVSGLNAVGQIDSGGVETAAESVRLSESGENRIADDRRQVESYLETCWRKEIMVNYQATPRRSSVRVLMPFDEKEETAEGFAPTDAEQTEQGGQVMADIPWQTARQLIKPIRDMQSAQEQAQLISQATETIKLLQQQMQAQQQTAAQMGVPIMPNPMQQQTLMKAQQAIEQADPKIRARVDSGVPLEATVELVEHGIEAFVGDPNLAALWEEDMSAEEVASELTVRIAQGSTRRLGHMQDFNEAAIVYKTLVEFFVSWQMTPQIAALHNFLIDSLDSPKAEDMKITAGELMQQMQMIQQQQMQMEMAKNQATAENEQQKHDNRMEQERTKAENQKQADERRQNRERERSLSQLATNRK